MTRTELRKLLQSIPRKIREGNCASGIIGVSRLADLMPCFTWGSGSDDDIKYLNEGARLCLAEMILGLTGCGAEVDSWLFVPELKGNDIVISLGHACFSKIKWSLYEAMTSQTATLSDSDVTHEEKEEVAHDFERYAKVFEALARRARRDAKNARAVTPRNSPN